jgi:hypothetical protein
VYNLIWRIKNDEYMKRLPVEQAVDFINLLWGLQVTREKWLTLSYFFYK